MQYYAIFPIIAWIFRKFDFKLSAVILVAIQVGLFVALHDRLPDHFPSMIIMKFHIFMSGMIFGYVFLNHEAVKSDGLKLWKVAAVLGAALPIAGHDAVTLGGRAVLALLLLVVVGNEKNAILGAIRRLLSTRPLKFAGDISFSVYLLHLPIMFVTIQLLGGPLRIYGLPFFTAVLSVTIVITYLLSIATYRFIELPGVALGRRTSALWGDGSGSAQGGK
jgi:peptidoglycan/LPS O-acetylase OafA/YrhL